MAPLAHMRHLAARLLEPNKTAGGAGEMCVRIAAHGDDIAAPDNCDFLHLSNSSYPEALDCARMRMAIDTFSNFLLCGGWAPLAEPPTSTSPLHPRDPHVRALRGAGERRHVGRQVDLSRLPIRRPRPHKIQIA
ncbi:hypothetical protein FB451DRAFT_1177144 [Mycena latifolia]|nr:hypothetical protein FB451DRAFT_1177144 [Mycena latifolia]